MGTVREGTAYCSNCDGTVVILRRAPRHVLHLLLSVASGGLWLPVWAGLAFAWHGWKCSRCGARIPWGEEKTIDAEEPSTKPWLIRHFEVYQTLEPWPFTLRITVEGLLVSLGAAILVLHLFGPAKRFSDIGAGSMVVYGILLAPFLETLLFQAIPVFFVRMFRGGFGSQLLAGSLFFALAHFTEGVQVGLAAGVIGGFYYGFTYVHWRQRSLWTALWTTSVSHSLHNLVAFAVLLTASRG